MFTKSIYLKYYILTFFISILFSCNNSSNSDDIINQQIQEEIQVIDETTEELEYSTSPINLNNLQVNFASNVSYGDFNKNVFDIFLPISETPTKLVLFIHGGGFLGGNKEFFYNNQESKSWYFPEEIRVLLENNIAVANMNYRVLKTNDSEGIIKPLMDSKKCLQFLRHFSEIINIDKTKIVLYGVSAGAGTSLWLNFHDDMADSSNSDSLYHESTRVLGAAALETQATYDLVRWSDNIFTPYNITFEQLLQLDKNRVFSFYGVNSIDDLFTQEIIDYRANVDMLGLMSSDDGEYWASNIRRLVEYPTTVGLATHHAFHVKVLKEYADEIGVSNVSYYGRDPLLFGDPSNETAVEFLIRKLNF